MRKQAVPTRFQRLSGLENALQSKTDFRRSIGWFDFFEQRELRELRDRIIHDNLPALECVRRAIGSMIPGMRNPRIDGSSGRFVVDASGPSDAPIKLRLDQLSDGYQVMLGVVMDFALRLALANPPDRTGSDPLQGEAILILDEVDLHLHPEWQQRVVPDLRRTFPNTQLILTTHSPQVATTVNVESIRVVKRRDGMKQVETPTFQTRGVESADVLSRIMSVDPVPKVPEAAWLNDYRALIEEGRDDSPEAVELRGRLTTHFGQSHPVMLDSDRLIRFTRVKKRRAEGGNTSHA